MAARNEPHPEGSIVLDDAIVNDGQPTGTVGMGMGVAVGGDAMGRPSGMSDPQASLNRFVGQILLQPGDLALGLSDDQSLAVHDGKPRRVVSPVFEALEARDKHPGGIPRANVAYDPTHGFTPIAFDRFRRRPKLPNVFL
jgi:hypothetical protein